LAWCKLKNVTAGADKLIHWLIDTLIHFKSRAVMNEINETMNQ